MCRKLATLKKLQWHTLLLAYAVDVCTQGLGKSCLYCGDGINDLAALAAADVGMALGSAEASAAATLTDRHYSVAGQPAVLTQPLCHLSFHAPVILSSVTMLLQCSPMHLVQPSGCPVRSRRHGPLHIFSQKACSRMHGSGSFLCCLLCERG